MSQEDELRLVHYVLSCHEHYPDDLGRYICPIPPHVDHNPSANVRIGDINNDAILGCFSHPGRHKAWTAAQLVEAFEGIDVFKAAARVEDYRDQMNAAGWVGPTPVQHYQKQRLDANILRIRREMAAGNQGAPMAAVEVFLDSRPDLRAFGVTADYLRDTWSITEGHPDYPGEIYIPFFDTVESPPGSGDFLLIDLECAKHRDPRPGNKPMSVAGSDFSRTLYGEWMDDGVRDVLLCEGESDTWAAHAHLKNSFNVLGLPSGARGPTATQLEIVGDRTVWIAFDNDDAGNTAALQWKEALPKARRLKLPVGSDICSLGPESLGQWEIIDEPYVINAGEFLMEPDPEWMIDGLIIEGGGIGQIIGSSTVGKTFVALDLALHVCYKEEWFGHKIRTNGPVVYACLENPSGFRKRVRAWAAQYNQGHVPNQLGVIRHHQINLTKAESVTEFLDGVRLADPAMVIIDTQAKATMGMDEDKAMDTGVMVGYIEAIAKELACPVILVHHSGYSDDGRPGGRGSSAMFAAMDFVMAVRWNQKTNERTIHFTKLKDGEPINPIAFHLESVMSVGSAVLVPGPRNNAPEEQGPPPSIEDWADRKAKRWIETHPGETPRSESQVGRDLRALGKGEGVQTKREGEIRDRILELLEEDDGEVS